MSQIDVNELRKLFSENTKKRKKADFASAVAKQKQKNAVEEATKKPPTKQEVLANKVKEMETQDKYNVLTGKGKPESGADAVDRLLDDYAEAISRVYNEKNEIRPELSAGVTPEKETIKGSRFIQLPGTDRVIRIPFIKKEFEIDNIEYDSKGKKGSAYRIAKERIEDVAGDLKLAQIAKEQGITLQEAKRNKQIEDKYNEYLKKFNVPSSGTFDGKKVVADKDKIEAKRRYLARMQTQNFFSK